MNIIITGAGKGIGFELTKKFAKIPDNRIIAVSRDISRLEKLEFTNLLPIAFDLSEINVKNNELVKRVFSEFNHVDILINNAGMLYKNNFEDIDIEHIKEMFEVNVFAPVILIKELIPLFSIKGKSHIVNIGSMGGVQGSVKFPGLSIYSASKAAISVLSECLAVELKDKDIACNCLALGSAQTEMFENAFPGLSASVSAEKMAEYIFDFSLNGHYKNNGKIIQVVFNDF
ncbi:MAG: hypothetical protein A2W91_17420 [Bacteroidetes bacterium GWF2_38_335]|nr:MAG: hypothetical protein A2W91_17420 [Bacteroidetes bacterium GWF2_38_335]OFY78646.1 MAG: hypothetical protein A2281_16450 [Bacteroidetes bacterium RIFOXYA12_FULL_38_20]HBS88359.1 short-chain dehydrogenase [Bacteroidales bacterium]